MEVTRQLLTERASKKGLARIQFTFCWNGQRLRLGSGQKCDPKDWDARRQRMKARPNTYAEAINLVIDRYTDAATSAWHAANLAGQVLSKEVMKAEILRRVAAAATDPAETQLLPPPLQLAPSTLLEQMHRWVEETVASRISRKSGRPIKPKVVHNHRRTLDDLKRFAQQWARPLTFENLDVRFYHDFLNFELGVLQRAPGTFNHYLGILRSFLQWADYEGLLVHRRFRDFLKPVESQTFVDALTRQEVLAIAAIDFDSPAVRAYVEQQFQVFPTHRRGVTHAMHLQRLRWTRDKFLLCTYTGLRIGDADRLAPHHLHGEVARVEAAKTGVTCIIPLLDDEVFKPAALLRQYAGLGLKTCLPFVLEIYTYLPHVAHLAGITRLPLGMHVGRKTFATLKIAQGVARSQVMMTTGHQTESSFNAYLGIDESELLDAHRKTARKAA